MNWLENKIKSNSNVKGIDNIDLKRKRERNIRSNENWKIDLDDGIISQEEVPLVALYNGF